MPSGCTPNAFRLPHYISISQDSCCSWINAVSDSNAFKQSDIRETEEEWK